MRIFFRILVVNTGLWNRMGCSRWVFPPLSIFQSGVMCLYNFLLVIFQLDARYVVEFIADKKLGYVEIKGTGKAGARNDGTM